MLTASLQQKLPVLKEIVFFCLKKFVYGNYFPYLWHCIVDFENTWYNNSHVNDSPLCVDVYVLSWKTLKLFLKRSTSCVCGLCGVWGLWKLFKISLRVSSLVCETLNIFQSSLCEARCWRLWKLAEKTMSRGFSLSLASMALELKSPYSKPLIRT